MQYLSLIDLFLVGLVLDITGALLLARGLLISPQAIASIAATLWGGNPEAARDRCRNRVDAEFGALYLALGFALQVIGYSLEIGGISSDTGAMRLIAAFVLAGFVAISAWTAWSLRHEDRANRLYAEAEAEDQSRRDAHDEWSKADFERAEDWGGINAQLSEGPAGLHQ